MERHAKPGLWALVLLPGLTACFPMPHTVQVFPAVQGVVRHEGKPVAKARIFAAKQSEDPDCTGTELVALTDPAGRFTIDPDRDLRLFLTVGDPVSTWIMCIEHDGVLHVGWSNYSLGYAPEAVEMECDLNRPNSDRPGGVGLCRWIAVP